MYTGNTNYGGKLPTYPRALPADEQLELVARAQKGDLRARDRLIETYLGLIAHRVRKLRAIDRNADVEDLVHDGVEGLITAVKKFDFSRGTRFTTYAQPWIDNSIRRALWSHREVGLHVANKIGTIVEYRNLAVELGPEEAARKVYESRGIREDTVRAAEEQLSRPTNISLESPSIRDDDESSRFVEAISETASLYNTDPMSPEQASARAELQEAVAEMFAGLGLSSRDVAILESRILAHPDDELPLRQIAEGFGISRERIRQLQVELVDRLRAAVKKSPRLSDYAGL